MCFARFNYAGTSQGKNSTGQISLCNVMVLQIRYVLDLFAAEAPHSIGDRMPGLEEIEEFCGVFAANRFNMSFR
jgi:hypothetical protein